MVVGLGVLLVHEVYIVGADELDAILMGQFYQHLVSLLLQGERLTVSPLRRVLHLMALQLKIVVVAKQIVIPLHGLTGTGHIALQNLGRHFACNAGRADNQSLVVALQVGTVGTGTHVVTVHP